MQVGVVPYGRSRGEDAGLGAQLRICIIAYAEAIGVVLASSCILQSVDQRKFVAMACFWTSGRDWNDSEAGLQTYQSKAGVKTLLEDGVRWVEDELGEEELVASFVDLFVCRRICGQLERNRKRISANQFAG